MAGLQGYQSQAGQVTQPGQAEAPALNMAANQLGSLSDQLASFSKARFENVKVEAAEQAKNDALNDAAAGKPFYKENIYTAYGKAYNDTLSATYASNADLMINKKSSELLTKFSHDPVGYSNGMDTYINKLASDAPTDSLVTVIGLTGNKLKNSVSGKLHMAEKQRLDASRKQTVLAKIEQDIAHVINMKDQGKDEDAKITIANNIKSLDLLTEDGVISYEDAQNIKDSSKFQILYGVSQNTMTKYLLESTLANAKKYLDEQSAENRSDMDVKENDVNQAKLLSMYNSELKKRKANGVNRKKWAKNVVKNAKSVRTNKKTPTNLREIEEAKKHLTAEELNDYNIQEQAMNIIDNYGDMSLSQMRATFEEYKKTTVSGRVDVEVENKIEALLAEREARAASDVVGLARQESIIPELDIPMGVQGGINGLMDGLSEMSVNTSLIQEEYGAQYTNLLSKSDAKEWNDWMDNPEIEVASKLALIDSIFTSYPNLAENVFNQIGGKSSGMFTFAASLSASGNTRAAEISLMGMKSGKKIEEGYAADLGMYLGNAFAGHTGSVEASMTKGILNYTRGVMSQTDSDDGFFSGKNMKDHVADSLGEIVTWNGQNTILPVGVSKNEFMEQLDNISIPGAPALQEGLRRMTDWTNTGGYQLRYKSPGKYIVRERGDNPRVIHKDGKPFILEWGKF